MRSPPRRGAARRRFWAVAGVASLTTWPVISVLPVPGLDPSWQAGLHLAARHGLHFGTDVVFTYGPLGFLEQPALWTGPTAALALLYAGVVWAVFAATLLRLLWPRVGGAWAFGLTWLVLAVTQANFSQLVLVLVLVWCLVALQHEASRVRTWLAPAGGAVAGLLSLLKPNTGLVCLAMVAAAVWVLPPRRWRSEARLVLAFASAFALGWVASGGAADALVPYFSTAAQVAAGYNDAMATDGPAWQYLLAGAFGASLALLVWRLGRRGRRPALAVVVGVVGFFQFKYAFVRADFGHAATFYFFAGMVALVLCATATGPGGGLLRWSGAGAATAAAAFVAFAVVLSGSAGHLGRYGLWAAVRDPVLATRHAASQAATMASQGRRERLVATARQAMGAKVPLDPVAVRLLAGHSVHIDSPETSLAWLHDLRWRPLPVFQSYAAYTSGLDELNARFLASPEAPERILRLPANAIDGRYSGFESPAATLAMLCHYREVASGLAWQVIARDANRCSGPRQLASARARAGEAVAVPEAGPDELVYARVRLRPGLAEHIRRVLWKPTSPTTVALDGATYRLVEATAADPLVLRAPPTAGFRLRFDSQPAIAMLRLDRPARVEFYAVAIPPAGGGGRP